MHMGQDVAYYMFYMDFYLAIIIVTSIFGFYEKYFFKIHVNFLTKGDFVGTTIHSTAVIEKGAEIGSDCKIGPFCHIGKNVTLGERNILHSHISIVNLTTIGEDNEYFPFSCIGQRTEDKKYKKDSITKVNIGNGNVFREYCTVNSATEHGSVTYIGNNNTFLSYSHVGHDCIIGNNVLLGCGSKLAGHVQMEDFVTVNGMTGVIQFVRLGRHSFIGAVNKVTKDILPFMIAEGNPSVMRVVNIVGLKRRGFNSERIGQIKAIMHNLFNTTNSLKISSQLLLDSYPEVTDICEIAHFITKSINGIAKFGIEHQQSRVIKPYQKDTVHLYAVD